MLQEEPLVALDHQPATNTSYDNDDSYEERPMAGQQLDDGPDLEPLGSDVNRAQPDFFDAHPISPRSAAAYMSSAISTIALVAFVKVRQVTAPSYDMLCTR